MNLILIAFMSFLHTLMFHDLVIFCEVGKWIIFIHLPLCNIHHESQTMLGIEDVKINKIKSHPSGAQMINEDKQASNMEKAKDSPGAQSRLLPLLAG